MFNNNIAIFKIEEIETGDMITFFNSFGKFWIAFNRDNDYIYTFTKHRDHEYNITNSKNKFSIKNNEIIYINLKTGGILAIHSMCSIEYSYLIDGKIPPINKEVSLETALSILNEDNVKLVRFNHQGLIFNYDENPIDKKSFNRIYSIKKRDQLCISIVNGCVYRLEIITIK